MRAIWKAILAPFDGVQEIGVPEGAELLTAREQGDEICVWFLCNPDNPRVARRVAIVMTGRTAPDWRYVGTALLLKGELVYHVFEDAEHG